MKQKPERIKKLLELWSHKEKLQDKILYVIFNYSAMHANNVEFCLVFHDAWHEQKNRCDFFAVRIIGFTRIQREVGKDITINYGGKKPLIMVVTINHGGHH